MRLANGLRMTIDGSGQLRARVSPVGSEFCLTPEVLHIMSLVGQKIPPEHMAQSLKRQFLKIQQNLPDQLECVELIRELIQAGIFVDQSSSVRKNHDSQAYGFGDPWIQWAMLADSPRNFAYAQALKAHVQKSTHVLDVGAGTGLLSALALENQAMHVCAIEESYAAHSIIPILQRLGLFDKKRFHLEMKNSLDARIPQNIDLVVSELFGNDPFQEGLLPTLRHVAKTLGPKKVDYIPKSVDIFFEWVSIADAHPIFQRLKVFYEFRNQPREKNSVLKQFLSAARSALKFEEISFPLVCAPSDVTRLTEPTHLAQMPLSPPPPTPQKAKDLCSGTKQIPCPHSKNQPVLGLLWFRANLDDHISISSHPKEKDAGHHWSPIALVPYEEAPVGAQLRIDYELADEENMINLTILAGDRKLAQR